MAKTHVTFFRIEVEEMRHTPCLIKLAHGQKKIVFSRAEVPPEIKAVYIVYDLPNGQPPAETIEEALGLCDVGLC